MMENNEDNKKRAQAADEQGSAKPESKPYRSVRAQATSKSAADTPVKRQPRGSQPARPGAAASASESLNKLQDEITLKNVARRSGTPSTPGVEHVSLTGEQASLERLERAITEKSHPPRSHGPDTKSNNESSTGRSQLSQFEREVRSKNRGRRPNAEAAIPGTAQAVATGLGPSGYSATGALTQRERDLRTKTQGRPGASAKTGGKQEGKRQGRSSTKSTASSMSSAQHHSNLRDLEADIMTKQKARHERQQKRGRHEEIQRLEDDVLIKNQARRERGQDAPVIAANLTGGATITAEASSAGAQTDALSLLQNFEAQVADKPSGPGSSQAAANPSNLSSHYNSPPLDEVQPTPSTQSSSIAIPVGSSDGSSLSQRDEERVPEAPPASLVVPSQIQGRGSRLRAVQDHSGIEAFVADNVVDAANVAVVKSEEEEEEEAKRRYKKYLCYGCLLMIVLAVAIVVPVALFAGGSDDDKVTAPEVPTAAPSAAPTSSPTLAPTSSRFDSFLEIARSISGEDVFQDRTSPQYLAALWVSTEDSIQAELSSSRILQRYILASFYFSTGGDGWLECGRLDPTCGGDPDETAWLSENDECTWLGIRCEGNSHKIVRITFLRRFGNQLAGSLPFELSLLTDLTALILQNNDLQGSLPSFLGSLTKLSAMILSGNSFEGTIPPVIFETLPLMGTIFLGTNKLNGEIPSILASLPNLSDLRLDDNSFEGKIPPQLGSLSNLRILELQNNQLDGSIPTELYGLSSIRRLQLNDNPLTGSLSSFVGQVQTLREFALNGTVVGGELPTELFTLPNLANLWLDNCNFSGTLSESFGSLTELVGLWANNNSFRGQVPDAFSSLTELNSLVLHNNDLTGSISPGLCARKGKTNAFLRNLTADCAGDPPEIFCPEGCCDVCVD